MTPNNCEASTVTKENAETSKMLHDKAMDIAESAFLMARTKVFDKLVVDKLYLDAFELEKEAANLLLDYKDCEPTRSVLYRSAGYFARDAGYNSQALEMADRGLMYCIHEDVRQELQELKEEASSKMYVVCHRLTGQLLIASLDRAVMDNYSDSLTYTYVQEVLIKKEA